MELTGERAEGQVDQEGLMPFHVKFLMVVKGQVSEERLVTNLQNVTIEVG
ncbi:MULTISPECIES: hypothetical protein [unclassified Bacillus (in: firmicutes)]|nr:MULTISPECIES: hypothetical protein [unclassified Bacillus (in: firmicutes)]